jgi:hypothetical protein
VDAHLQKYIDAKFDHLEAAVKELKAAELACQDEVFGRLRLVEIQIATNMAASWRGAFVIGACSLVGASIAMLIGKIL